MPCRAVRGLASALAALAPATRLLPATTAVGLRRRCLRDTNVTIRWLILHRVTMNKKLAELCAGAVNPDEILKVRL